MLNKKLLPAALATALLAGATVAQAEMEISGNVALTSGLQVPWYFPVQ